jgi:hypothetical protein
MRVFASVLALVLAGAMQGAGHGPFGVHVVDQDGGRIIYFEGTYTSSFSDAKQDTPRYNYNQIMYRLRLDEPRLQAAAVSARTPEKNQSAVH